MRQVLFWLALCAWCGVWTGSAYAETGESCPEGIWAVNGPCVYEADARFGAADTDRIGALTAATIITINSTADYPQDGKSKKCSDAGVDECTLRRAINQAYALSGAERPVAIVFDISTADSGYLPELGAWKITLGGTTADELRELYGKTILDGSTQPGGRSNGPKIILDGAGSKNYGLIFRQNENIVRGMALQNFRTAHISVSSNDNGIERCWFGLSDDGQSLSSGDISEPEGGSGVAMAAGASRNTISNNVITGFFGVAAAIRGDDNVFAGNWIGTRADGTVPVPSQFQQHPCLVGAWEGGSGITVEGKRNLIGGPGADDGNVFVGLFLDATDQGPAVRVSASGEQNILQNNRVGLDAYGTVIGVCGRGFDFGSGPKNMNVLNNQLIETGLSAILMNGPSLNGNTLQGTIIWRTGDWPAEQGMNTFAEAAIAYGPTVPGVLRNFTPARVISINGTTVSGGSGTGSPCPGCTVELFLDDTDDVTETLESLAVVIADGNGAWTATLPEPLKNDQGLRTMSTVPDTFTIIGLAAGSTSNISELYRASQDSACEVDEDCEEGEICEDGECVAVPEPECIDDNDCADGERCDNGICVSIVEPECALSIKPESVRSARFLPTLRVFRISGSEGFDPHADVVELGDWRVVLNIPAGGHILVMALVPAQLESGSVVVSVGACTGEIEIQ